MPFQQVDHVTENSKERMCIILEMGAKVKNYHQLSQNAFKLMISTEKS